MTTALAQLGAGSLDRYMGEVNRHPVLSREQEYELAVAYHDRGELEAAHALVVSNLRFVVKVAHEFKGYGLALLDLVQEGNVGLMMAVKKFDPHKGYRLISYAVWWIRAYMKSFIARSWSMVRMGSTRAQKKLFFKLRSKRGELEREAEPGVKVTTEDLAEAFDVDPGEIESMEYRLAARDFYLDAQVMDGGSVTHTDRLEDDSIDPEVATSVREERAQLRGKVEETLGNLSERERYIVEKRLYTDDPMTLQEIGDHFQVTRERARQIETKVIQKLRVALRDHTSKQDDAQAA